MPNVIYHWTDEDDRELLRLHREEKISRHKIAARMGRSYGCVYDRLRKLEKREREEKRAALLPAPPAEMRACLGTLCQDKPRSQRLFTRDPHNCFHMCRSCRDFANRHG